MTLEQNVGVVRFTKPQISLTFVSEEDADRDERSRRRVNICKCRTSRCLWGDIGTFSAEFVETEPGSCSPNTNQVVCVPEQTKVRAKVWTFVKKHTYIRTYVGRSLQLNSESSERGCRLSLSSLYKLFHQVQWWCWFLILGSAADKTEFMGHRLVCLSFSCRLLFLRMKRQTPENLASVWFKIQWNIV